MAALAGEGAATSVCKAGPKPRGGVSVCVLPFANMSGDAEQEYFSDGISEDITTDLSKVSAMEVIARNTAFQFKGQSVDVGKIARKLNVSHVLEGSVRKAGSRVRITAQLIDGSSGGHVWAERYDRELDDIFAIQDEISRAIVDALKVKLLPQEKQAIGDRCTCNAEAYNLYLMARNYWITGNHGDRRREERVIRLCSRAVEIDPDYAPAWALLSLAQVILRFSYGQAGDDGTAAANRAIALDPGIAEAYVAMARFHGEHDALDEAMTSIERALELDPDSWEANKEAGRLLMRRRKIPEAASHYKRSVAVMDSDYHGWGMLLTCLHATDDREEEKRVANKTFAEVEKALAQDPGNGAAISFGVAALSVLGKKDQAKEWIDKALLLDPDNLNMRYNFACALAANLGDREGAIALLETTLPRATGTLGVAETDPELDSIRDDPRFQKLIADRKAELARQAQPDANPAATSAPPRS
ncbi:MAG: TPR end-of-group domain-containing protein [Sphingomicrobium sp.]